MKNLFRSIDTDNSGTITVEELRNSLSHWGHKIHEVGAVQGCGVGKAVVWWGHILFAAQCTEQVYCRALLVLIGYRNRSMLSLGDLIPQV